MAELTTIARPYAKAAFEHALAGNALTQWSGMLQLAAVIAADSGVQALLGNPRISSSQLAELFHDVGGASFDEHGKNFLSLLADNNRLNAISEIVALFEVMKAEHEKSVDVRVTAAAELNADLKAKLAAKLEAKLARKVNLSYDINPSLLGGLIIRAGDMVIDGSVRGKLGELGDALRA
ncbi:MAG: F0F1 ATP synthase subunit delta [Gammaproteobacteria bacterium]|nr:F0F1 ATP synthase subunit delta [Gammaproteobacteria bacterium]